MMLSKTETETWLPACVLESLLQNVLYKGDIR